MLLREKVHHLRRLGHASRIKGVPVMTIAEEIECPWCRRQFGTPFLLQYHLKICPVKAKNEEPNGDMG